jgi:biopolymer transport protein ExbD
VITRPFNFEAMLRPPSSRFDPVAFVDVAVIGLFFVILNAQFVLAPGLSVRLPTVAAGTVENALATKVLTLDESEGAALLIFEGRMCTLESFDQILRTRAGEFDADVLLIRADEDVSLELLAKVWQLAAQAGFARTLLAAEPDRAVGGGGP